MLNYLRQRWYWTPVWSLVFFLISFTVIRLQSEWPMGDIRFIYPLRFFSDLMWFYGARWVLWLVQVCLLIAPVMFTVWLVFLTNQFLNDHRLEIMAKSFQVYTVLTIVAIIGLFFVLPAPSLPEKLDHVSTQTSQYRLDKHAFYTIEIVYLLECDNTGILCRHVASSTGWENDDQEIIRLSTNGDNVLVESEHEVLFIYSP